MDKETEGENINDVKMEEETARTNEDEDENDPEWSSFMADASDKKLRKTIIQKLKQSYEIFKPTNRWINNSKEGKMSTLQDAVLCTVRVEVSIEEAQKALMIMEPQEEKNPESYRRAMILDGLDTDLAHGYDLQAFSVRIDDLFDWHKNETTRNKYAAPYFALIQSSGMGKTKLLTEYREQCNKSAKDVLCKTILCVKARDLDQQKERAYFDHTLVFDSKESDLRNTVWSRMNKLIEAKGDKAKKRIVLLFDEAEGLMKGDDRDGKGSLVFRSIRWWLRQDRNEQEVVAVFTGTNAKLSNFFPPDPPVSGPSRDPQENYKNYKVGEGDTKSLYQPFFELNTVACLRTRSSKRQKKGQNVNEFAKAAMYARPLFAYYESEQELNQEKLEAFAHRLVLSKHEYQHDNHACYSVLGSRVQMGILNSFDVSSKLIAGGYACLVGFEQQKTLSSSPVAHVTFMPDPVCATIAMRLMDETPNLGEKLPGSTKTFWVEKATAAFVSHLCRPEKGDAGEVFSALYMLFCGDVLRKQRDKSLRTFSVPLAEWFRLLRNGGDGTNEKAPSSDSNARPRTQTRSESNQAQEVAKAAKVSEMKVSFIQFCRNHWRSNSFCSQNVLEYMYRSGVAFYTYTNCKSIDQAASIRVVYEHSSTPPSYHPLLISVKNWASATQGNVTSWVASMKSFLDEMRNSETTKATTTTNTTESPGGTTTAVCLLILIGCSRAPSDIKEHDLSSSSLDLFPAKDVYRLVCVPEDDQFGVTKAVQTLGLNSEGSEIYSSHAFLSCEDSSSGVLRSKSKSQERVESLHQAMRGTTLSFEHGSG